jgi:outer membrane murein-binding lipoprotein Lpp
MRAIPRILAFVALVSLCGVIAIAQAQVPDTVIVTAQPIDQRTDGQIETDVVHTLDASRALKSDLITAATIQGEVTLSGTVSSEASSELAESIAAHVAGVAKVHNNLKVGDPQAPQAAQPAAPGAQQMADSQADDSMAPHPLPHPRSPMGRCRLPARARIKASLRLRRSGRSTFRPIRALLVCRLPRRHMKLRRGR